jgi:putative hydrolase of the HAD superfamily
MFKTDFLSKIKENSLIDTPIRNVIFDLGNVVINIDPELTISKYKELGIANFDEMYTLMRQSNVFDRLDTGKITLPEFRQAVRDFSQINLADAQIDEAWCAMLLDFPEENVELLRKLRAQGYKLYLLSNTNEMHIDFYTKYMDKQFGRNLLTDLFDRVFYSHEIGYRKPDRESYEYVLNAANLKPAESLFIDDLEHNVVGARQTGMLAYHHPKGDRLVDLFS